MRKAKVGFALALWVGLLLVAVRVHCQEYRPNSQYFSPTEELLCARTRPYLEVCVRITYHCDCGEEGK